MTTREWPKLTVDPATRMAYLDTGHDSRWARTERVWPGINLDVDDTGEVIGIEIFLPNDASGGGVAALEGEPTTEERLAELDRLDSEATPGPWVAECSGEQGNCVIPSDAQSTREAVCVTRLYHQAGDADLIAALRNAYPALAAALRAQAAQIQRFKVELDVADDVMAYEGVTNMFSRQLAERLGGTGASFCSGRPWPTPIEDGDQ